MPKLHLQTKAWFKNYHRFKCKQHDWGFTKRFWLNASCHTEYFIEVSHFNNFSNLHLKEFQGTKEKEIKKKKVFPFFIVEEMGYVFKSGINYAWLPIHYNDENVFLM